MKRTLSFGAAIVATSLFALPVLAQTAPSGAVVAPAQQGGPLPTTIAPGPNGQINQIRGAWEQSRNALIQARSRANAARQAAAQAEQAEFQALLAYERANLSLIGVMAAATGRPPVPPALTNLPPELPPPNVPAGQPQPGQPQPAQPPRP